MTRSSSRDAGEMCPACQGSGKTKRFRRSPMIVAIASLPFLLLGLVLAGHLWRQPKPDQVVAGLVSFGLPIAFLVFAKATGDFLGRGRCPACGGRGILGGPTAGAPFIWQEDRFRLQPGACRKCGYNLTGNTSGVCPECGTDVLKT